MNTIKKFIAVFVSMALMLSACSHSSQESEAGGMKVAKKEAKRPMLASEAMSLDLDSLSEREGTPSEDHLFGKFFNDRAEYFIIENPSNTIFQTNVHSITLFHLDGKLGQTKYVLENNIASALLQQFGACKIVGLDSLSKIIVGSEPIVSKREGKFVVNARLTAYELRWVLDDREIRYRVRENEEKDNFVFVERLKSYNTDLLQIENVSR